MEGCESSNGERCGLGNIAVRKFSLAKIWWMKRALWREVIKLKYRKQERRSIPRGFITKVVPQFGKKFPSSGVQGVCWGILWGMVQKNILRR